MKGRMRLILPGSTAWCVFRHGLWLSLVERCVRVAEAVGSNPTSPIFFFFPGRRLPAGRPKRATADPRAASR
jgi:hypothetical protein